MSELIFLDAEATAKYLPFEALIDALEDGFTNGCEAPVRHHHTMAKTDEPDATLLLMPAWSKSEDEQQFLGIKLVTVVPGNTARNLPGLVSTYVLLDSKTGTQLAILDGNTITGYRTVATSALAARYLAREDASKLLVLGAGRVASLIPKAYRAVRPITDVAVWDINPKGAAALVESLNKEGFNATVVDDLEAAARKADIISAATLAMEPLILGDWLRPGTHLDLIGGFRPNMREADDAAVRVSEIYVDTNEALIEAGDIVQPLNAGVISKDSIRGTLAQLVRSEAPARSDDASITYFKAVGSALADLVSARLIYQSATAK